MRPSEVRRRILEEHARLRGLLSEVESLVELLRQGHEEMEPSLRERGTELHDFFLRHLELEDVILVTALREADGWGDERAGLIACEHREQRELMSQIHARLIDGGCPGQTLARELGELSVRIREDMCEEERVMLDERVLRDDVIAIDVKTG